MNMKPRNILLVGTIVCILALSGTVAAVNETDSTGDVWHYQETDSGWSWKKYSGDKPNIDITEVSQSFDGNEVTLTMKVNGEIEDSEDITYWIHLEGDNSNYIAQYSNNQGIVGGEGAASSFYHMISDPISGDTFTATFEIDNTEDSYNVYGYTSEYAGSEEQWGDYAPAEFAPWYSESDSDETDDPDDETINGGNDTTDGGETDDSTNGESTGDGGNGTPGFEILSLFVAIAAVLLVLTKRKKYQ